LGFVKDRYRGRTAEQFVKDILIQAGITVFPTVNKCHDISFHFKQELTAEVKFDIYSAKSGRVAFEVSNPKTGQPTGIYNTSADLLFYVFSDTFHNPVPSSVYVCAIPIIQKFLLSHKPVRTIRGAGDGNSTIWLYEKDAILDVFDNITIMNKVDIWKTLDLILQLVSQ